MSRLINTTTMTVDGVTDVDDWYVAEGDHEAAAISSCPGAGSWLAS